MYDIDDDGRVGFGDLAFFATAQAASTESGDTKDAADAIDVLLAAGGSEADSF
jgi:hypothetical protein